MRRLLTPIGRSPMRTATASGIYGETERIAPRLLERGCAACV
jgi:hypothetical protein